MLSRLTHTAGPRPHTAWTLVHVDAGTYSNHMVSSAALQIALLCLGANYSRVFTAVDYYIDHNMSTAQTTACTVIFSAFSRDWWDAATLPHVQERYADCVLYDIGNKVNVVVAKIKKKEGTCEAQKQ